MHFPKEYQNKGFSYVIRAYSQLVPGCSKITWPELKFRFTILR